ncbi:MAG: glycosyltransferase family 2 protein [Acidobacteriota bacterium]|nr:glycosyltransferase family 2 protein [Acidobacteriota bacterium]MDQ5871741.1 glycosyltransferase family 2 protein [Acidobacteriota bacterium]
MTTIAAEAPEIGPKARPELSIVLPVFDEEENLRPLDSEIRQVLRSLGKTAEIIYVDDCSRDRSLSVLETIAAGAEGATPRTRVVKLRRNFGQTAAMAAGFDLAEGEVILPLDADGQNNPADIPRLLETLGRGYDVVSGWRRRRRDATLMRKFPSRVANLLISRLSGVRLHDHGCTLKAYRASLLKEISLYGEMHRFIPVYLARRGARVTEIEVDHRARRTGVSKYGGQRILRVLLDLVLIRFVSRFYSRPMQFFGQIALWFLVATLAVGLLMVAIKFGWLRLVGIDYQASFIETPLPAVAAAFVIGIINSLFFGVLGEILIRADYESRGAKPYAVEAIFES